MSESGLEAPLLLACKVEKGKKKTKETVTFDPVRSCVKFEDEEIPIKEIVTLALEKFGGALVFTTAKKETVRLTVEKGSSEMLMDIAENLDAWCQETGSANYKPLKGRALKRRSRGDLLNRRKSGGIPGTGGDSIGRKSSGGTIQSLKALNSSVEVSSDDDDLQTLPENLESMKTGFLQYRRMQLKGQVAGGGDKKDGGLEAELNENVRLENEAKALKAELEEKKSKLAEREKAYFQDGLALQSGFLEVAKHVNQMGKSSLAAVFRDLQSEYAKALGQADGSSSESDDDAADSAPSTPSKIEKLTGGKPTGPKNNSIRLERSDSTIGWVRAKPMSTGVPLSKTSEGTTDRFRAIVENLEAALYLDRPMDNVLDAVKEKSRRLQGEIDEMRSQIDVAQTLLENEEELIKEVQENLGKSKALVGTLAQIASGDGAEDLQQWIINGKGKPETLANVKSLTEAQLHRQQTYLEVITKDYVPSRGAMEMAEDGSLFGCRADVLFELLISGVGQKKYVDFENAFMYGFRSFLTPVSLLQRFIEAFCTTPNEYRSVERTAIHLARLRVLRLINTWIELHEYDTSGKQWSSLIHSFLDTVSIAGYESESKNLRGKLTGNQFYDGEGFDKPYPESVVPANLKSGFSFLDLDPLEMARQITLQDAAIYQGMQTRELLDCQWTKAGGKKAPTVLVITQRFNAMANWVGGVILREDDIAKRAKCMESFIKTAEHLLELQNFNGVMQLIASLSKTEIVRLQKTHAMMSRDSRKAFESLRKLLDKNCAKLRDLYKEAVPPCLPYIGTFMTDLTFIGEMKPRLGNGMINYRKLQLQAASLDSLLGRRGQILYRLKEVKEIRDFIGNKDLMFANEDEAYQRSLQIEPRDSGRKG